MNAFKRYTTTLLYALGFLFTAVLAGCGGGDQGRDPILGLPSADLVSLAITPATPSIAYGASQQFVATASYTDGSTRDVTVATAWTSATPAVATINATSGLAKSVAAGSSVISASYNGKTATTTLTVLPPALVSITLTPLTPNIAISAAQQMTVIGTFSDNTSRDITASSSFSSATPAVATINAAGLAVGVSGGTSLITATSGGRSASTLLTVNGATLVSVALTPTAPSIATGGAQQFTLTGSFSNNTKRDISAIATFSSANAAVATISAGGLASGKTAGTSVISASIGTLSASTVLTVRSTTLTSIALTPQDPTVQLSGIRQQAVIATYSDGSTGDVTASSTFVSANPTAATVTSSGLIAGIAPGTSVVTATYGGKIATSTVTVPSSALVSIAVTPATSTVGIGGQLQFVATATYADNTTAVINSSAVWTSSNIESASVLNTGVATGTAVGTTVITANAAGKAGTAVLNVQAGAPVKIVQPVTLGSAATFGVLAGTALTNNAGGTTLISGNVGSPSQTVDPVLAAGFTNYKSGTVLSTALTDLQAAVTEANGRACDVFSIAGVDLGGMTLTPGVYCYAGSIAITGTLTLNGPGVYIFRTPLTFNTAANAAVVLINGATADNVSWVPGGITTLGANGAIKGSILAQAAVTIGDGTTLVNGRVLSAAAVTLRNNQIAK